MELLLKPGVKHFVQSQMETGQYSSESEVVEQALRLLEQALNMYALEPNEMRAQIAEGLASLDRGEGVDGEEFLDELEANLP